MEGIYCWPLNIFMAVKFVLHAKKTRKVKICHFKLNSVPIFSLTSIHETKVMIGIQ